MKLKRIAAVLTVASLCLGITACGTKTEEVASAPAVEETAKNKNVTLTESWEFDSGFYPVVSTANSSNYGITYWTHNFYDTLVKYNESGEIVGSIAESWDVSEDGMTYTFKLRDGVKFSDGTELTSEAVKQSIDAAIVNLGMYNGTYGKLTVLISSMETPDDKTFVLKLTNPYYGTLNDLTMSCPLAIVNPAAFEGGAEKVYENLSASTAGTGPYMYEGDYDGTTYTFVSNPYYWGEKPEAETFKVKVIPENDSKVLALRNGEIDGVLGSTRLNYDSFASLEGEEEFGTSVATLPTLTRYLGLNLSKAPFNDDAVRKALALAIDQQSLETAVFNGIETAAEGLFP
ncbi:MAG: peptide ABC transporter substrate-binding protein, partial [Lachnospiraceae bacterium]|nr:peptide ABC transporter substrate-binding protein [Lachnospiraceae bacterium]